MRALFALALVSALGGCKAPTPIADARRDRQEQIDDVNSQIDLAIALNDKLLIDSAQSYLERLHKAWSQASDDKQETIRQQIEKAEAELDKVLDTAARHRHR